MRFFRIFPPLTYFLLISATLLGQPSADRGVRGLQHTGGIHFYLVPGPFELSLFKQDGEGRADYQIMHALFMGPDGARLDSATLYGTTEARLTAWIKHAGVYTLITAMNNDQQMRTVRWGFRSNALHFMINSSAGHTDGSRREPIVLDGDARPFGVFFKPSGKTFRVSATGLPEAGQVALYNGRSQLLEMIPIHAGKIDVQIHNEDHSGIWELRLPQQKGTVDIEGLTYGWPEERAPLPVWTTSRESYFELGDYHWLLSPRRFARQAKSGSQGEVSFSVYNNSEVPMPVRLALAEQPEIGTFRLSREMLNIPPGESAEVQLQYRLNSSAPKGLHDLLLLAENPVTGKQAFSRLEFRVDLSEYRLRLPIQLELYEHRQYQFAYEPDYPRENQFYFDSENRPWLVGPDGLKVKTAGHWSRVSLPVKSENIHYPGSTIGTDKLGYVYTIVEIDDVPHVLRVHAVDLNPELVALPKGGTYKMETYMGGKASEYPPVILRFHRRPGKGRVARWARVHSLELFLTRVHLGKLHIEDPVLVSDNCVGTSDHSGITNSVASEQDKIYLVWGETSDPKGKDPGVPTYTRVLDRNTGQLSEPQLLAYSPPVNDVHNMSSILIDSRGNKHVIIGAHGRPFQYLKQSAGSTRWSPAKKISKLGQTYVGAVLDKQDGLHLFSRTWRKGDQFPGRFDAALYVQHKTKNETNWNPPQPFALPALSGYSIYYHRLTVDRNGKLYLSMDYWPTWSVYRESYRDSDKRTGEGKSRLVFTSEDGHSWKLLRSLGSKAAGNPDQADL